MSEFRGILLFRAAAGLLHGGVWLIPTVFPAPEGLRAASARG